MVILLWFIVFQITVLVLAYFRVRFILSTFVLAIYLFALTFYPFTSEQFNLTTFQSALAFWIPFGIIALLFNIPILRRMLLMNPIRYFLKKSMPAISQTEKEALEAGTVWWDAELFSGKPDWSKLMAYPTPQLSAEEQAFIDGPVNEFCAMLSDWKINHEDYDLTSEAWQFLKDKGFFGMIIPKKYGGLEFSALAHSCVVMKIASRSTSGTVTVMVPNSLGPAELLLKYGTKEQKDHYLPRLAKGQEIPCFALTGPEAGSDAGSMPDTGIICHNDFKGKKNVLGIRLNWDKRYITLGPVATVLGLAFKLFDPDHLLGDKEELGITLALIPTDTPGVSIGNRHVPLNQFFQVGPNWGKDVFIPMDWIIGGADRVGHGWRMLMESLAAGRSISLPALSTGGGKLVCRATGAYSRIRKQFKIPIGRFEGIEEALARMAGNTYMMDAARRLTCVALDISEKPSVISAIVKYNLTETMRQVVNDSMDIQGGSAICMGPDNLWASTYQGVPVSITVEGANILTRSLIIFGQGAIRCHPYALKEIEAIANPDSSVASKEFDSAFFRHLGFTLSNAFRTGFLGFTGGIFAFAPSGKTKRIFQKLTRLSSAFALTADIALFLLGGALKRKEKISGRFADILSQMYLASSILKHFKDQGSPKEDLPLVQWSCEQALYKGQEALDQILKNFPNAFIAWILRPILFPFGKTFSPPKDRLGQRIANILLEPSPSRDRLTEGVYLPEDEKEKMALLEKTLKQVIAAEPIEKKLLSARREGKLKGVRPDELIQEATRQGIIDENEACTLKSAEEGRSKVIQVDNFPASYFKAKA